MNSVMIIGGSNDGEVIETYLNVANGGWMRLHELEETKMVEAKDMAAPPVLSIKEYYVVPVVFHNGPTLLFGIDKGLYSTLIAGLPISEITIRVMEHVMRGYRHATTYQSTKP